MKRLVFSLLFIFAVVLVIFMAGVINKSLSPPPSPPDAGVVENETRVIASEKFGFSFEYGRSERTYVVQENAPYGDVVFSRTLLTSEDFAGMPPPGSATEGPPGITVQVIRNGMRLPLEEWVMQSRYSNSQLAVSDIAEMVIGGTNFLAYEADGLYRMDTYVAAHEGYIFMAAAAWFDEHDPKRDDARAFLETLEFSQPAVPSPEVHGDIQLERPTSGAVISSPLHITGIARGPWYFEAVFPAVLVDWDGRIIGEAIVSADGEWMTERFVPFAATLEFESPYKAGDPDFMKRGTLILQRSNPSGLSENDAAIEIPIQFGL